MANSLLALFRAPPWTGFGGAGPITDIAVGAVVIALPKTLEHTTPTALKFAAPDL
jgi:hypothetical protein